MNGFLLALTASTLVLGQEAGGSTDPPGRRASATKTEAIEYDGRVGDLAVPSPWRADASIRIDGMVGDVEWADAPILSGFTQSNPVEGIPASQRTEVRMLITDDAVYLGVKAFDDDVDGIRAAFAERDSFSRRDDYIRFILDTFDDQRRGYVIMVNPLGVQADGLWLEGGGGRRGGFGPPIDWNPDFIWESAGKIYDWGYAAEIKIPFKSLRFPETDLQDWGFQVDRKIQRNGYEASWAPVSGNVSNKLSQFGSITGLKELDAGLFFEINPVQTLTKQGSFSPATQAFERSAVTGEFGLNLTYGLTSNLTLDGTYNPDFSQVEADAGQIAVNERFSLFFREKRSFFLEGTEIFKLPKQLVYTRSIANPVGGMKLTGKVGSFNVGYLGAVDEVSDASVLDGKRNPVVNLLRVRRDMGASSNVGMVYTDRTSASDIYNRVLGFDGRFVFNQRNTITLLGAGSRTALDGGVQALTGGMFSARFDRTGRNFGFNLEIEDVAPDFKAGSGFIRRLGETQFQANTNYNFRGKPGDLIERWGPRLSFKGYWDHNEFWDAGGMRETELDLNTSVSFRGNVTLWGTLKRAYFDFPASTYTGLEVALPGGGAALFTPDQSLFQGLSTASLFVMANTWDRVNISGRVQVGETPLFDFRTGTPVDVAKQLSGNMDLKLFPTPNFATEFGVRYSRLKRSLDNSLYSEAVIPRVKAQYQFSRALFFRTIFEYGSSERGGLMDPVTGEVISFCRDGSCSAIGGRDSNDFSIETLLSYEPTPGTVFFLGYGREMEDTGAFRFKQVRAQADGVFVKISYRFRM